ncbi:hypothetical protein ISCGN_011669 [Ixodes scapularis]
MNDQLVQLSTLLNLLSYLQFLQKLFFLSFFFLRLITATLYVKMLLLLKSPAGTWLTWRFWFLHRRLETLSLAVLLGLLTNVSAFYDANFFLLQFFFFVKL